MTSISEDNHQAKHHLSIVAGLLSMIGPFSIDTYLPSFPAIEQEFGVSHAVMSQSLAVYLAAFAIFSLFWGPLGDRVGRRHVILGSLLLYVMASIGCALAESADTFLMMRMLQGIAAGGSFISGRAMIQDVHDLKSAHRAMSHMMLLFALSPAIAPILGGWLHGEYGWRSVFWFLAGFGVLMTLITLFIEETLPHHRRQSLRPLAVGRVYLATLRNRRFLGLIFSLAFCFAGLFLFIAGAPVVIYDFLGLDSHDFGVQFVPMVCGMMIGSYISGRLSHLWPITRTVAAGFGVMLLAVGCNLLFVSAFDASIFTLIGPLVLYTLGVAIAMPAIAVLALECFPQHRGTGAAMQGFIQMLINAGVASLAVPLLHTQWLHFVLGQLTFLLLALTLWMVTMRSDGEISPVVLPIPGKC